MTNSTEQILEGEVRPSPTENPNNNNNNQHQQHDQSREWQPMARAWVSAFPEGQSVTGSQVEVWLDSNFGSLPADLQSMPRSDIIDRLLSIQDVIKHLNQEKVVNQVDPPARFQRTDQWIPVYAWLESLDQDEAVKSKDISDWLDANPQFKDQLCSRHSRYHLMHYIKKCHLKILKRRERKGLQQSGKEAALPNKETALPVQKTVVTKQPPPLPSLSILLEGSPPLDGVESCDFSALKRKNKRSNRMGGKLRFPVILCIIYPKIASCTQLKEMKLFGNMRS